MSWGPFNSEEGGKPIMNHLANEVLPAIKEIQKLSLALSDYKQNFFNSLFRFKLSKLQEEYRVVNKKFLKAYHVYQTPDELFKNDNSNNQSDNEKRMATIMIDYFGSQGPIKIHFQEGFQLLEVIDRNLTRYSQSADQRVSIFLSILAITISIIFAILKIS